MLMDYRVLVINPGSTSTKIAIFDGDEQSLRTTLRHSTEEITKFSSTYEQKNYREKILLQFLSENKIELNSIHAVVGRGGLLNPLPGGTYKVNEKMIEFLKYAKRGEHASNLGAIIAKSIADKINVPSFIVDPVVVDEMENLARFAGHTMFSRVSIFHALNQKAVARLVAKEIGKDYKDCNFVVTHLGGGISVAAHKGGKVIDVNNALDGEGPFSPERSGTLPTGQLVEMCFSGKYDKRQVKQMLKGKGGVVSYLNTNNMFEVEQKVLKGDEKYREVIDAMCYQIAKEIGAYSTVLKGEVDRIIITGGIANDTRLIEEIIKRVCFIAPVSVYPGEEELKPLSQGALRVLRGEEKAKEYK
jgi:butyrate kinase